MLYHNHNHNHDHNHDYMNLVVITCVHSCHLWDSHAFTLFRLLFSGMQMWDSQKQKMGMGTY